MFAIYENFLALGAEKQTRIRNAALRAFGRHGYKKASMEPIAKAAGISKGMIFHYFDTKLGLFEYLIEYAYDFFYSWFGNLKTKIENSDYIAQYHCVTKIKLKAYQEQPFVFEFLTMMFMHPENIEISEKVLTCYEKTMVMRNKAFADLQHSQNTTFFRDDIDTEKAKKYISWFIEGYTQNLLANLGGKPLADMDIDNYWDEFDDILVDLKKLFYKPNWEVL